jgi:hypothetical protein
MDGSRRMEQRSPEHRLTRWRRHTAAQIHPRSHTLPHSRSYASSAVVLLRRARRAASLAVAAGWAPCTTRASKRRRDSRSARPGWSSSSRPGSSMLASMLGVWSTTRWTRNGTQAGVSLDGTFWGVLTQPYYRFSLVCHIEGFEHLERRGKLPVRTTVHLSDGESVRINNNYPDMTLLNRLQRSV